MNYLNDKKYIEAENLYIDAINSNDEKEQIKLLKQTIDICYFYFDAKTAYLELTDANYNEYQNEIDDIYKFMNDNNIIIDDGNYYDYEIGKSLLRAYYRMYKVCDDYDLKLDIIKIINKLDKNDHFKQKLELLISLIRCKKYDDFLNKYKNPTFLYEYIGLYFICLVKKDYDNANRYLLEINKLNKNFIAILFGIMIITDEDSKRIFEDPYFDDDSEEAAFYFIQKIGEAIDDINDLLSLYINNNIEFVMPYISAGNYELYVLLILLTLKEVNKIELVNELKGIGKKRTDYFESLEKLSLDDINELINVLNEKGFIKKDGENYRITYLGYSILKSTADNYK